MKRFSIRSISWVAFTASTLVGCSGADGTMAFASESHPDQAVGEVAAGDALCAK